LIVSIVQFIQYGTVPSKKVIPASSCKQADQEYRLHPEALMVYGAFKNDLITRIFLKKLIGNHFHYTVFGLDWIKARWFEGKPPTYAEFAHFWQDEYTRRQGKSQDLKPEWAYLNFAREFKKNYPDASKNTLLDAWESIRKKHTDRVLSLLRKSIKCDFDFNAETKIIKIK
jgi:hypothetical protein